MTHGYNIIDKDPFFEIDDVTRKIVNPASSDIAIVQFDHNSERFTFRLNKDVEGHDMTQCNRIEVHYKNTDAATQAETLGVYEVTDLEIDPEDETKVVCTWLISQNATQRVGKLDFLLRFSCVDADGTIKYAWNTSIFTGIMVSAGLYNTEEVLELYTDVLEQWKTELFSLSAEGVENINTAREQALTDIDNAMSNVHLLSNSLRGNVISNSVNLTDVSPIEHTMSVKVKSKNIVSNVGYVGDNQGITGEPGQAVISVAKALPMYKGKTYTVSWDTENTGATVWFTFISNYRGSIISSKSSPKYDKCDGTRKYVVFEMTKDCLVPQGWTLQASSNNSVNTGRCSNLMIEEGDVATEYTPYMADISDVWVGIHKADGSYDEVPTNNGTLEVTSAYPTMSVQSMNPYAVVDVSYNRDINKAFAELEQKLTNAVISLGGNV